MDSVRTAHCRRRSVLHRVLCPPGTRATPVARQPTVPGVLVLDLVYIATALVLFALVGLIARGVENL